jgi:hypothetical protein
MTPTGNGGQTIEQRIEMTDPRINRHRIDQTTYDLLVVLSAKLEALRVYERFDGGRVHDRQLRERLTEDDRRHADLLVDALRHRLGTAPRGGESTKEKPSARSQTAGDAGFTPVWAADRR